MAVKVKNLQQKPTPAGKMYTLTERVFVSMDGKRIAGAKDTPAKLLGGIGMQIPYAQAEGLGLVKGGKPGENKGGKPEADKSEKPEGDK